MTSFVFSCFRGLALLIAAGFLTACAPMGGSTPAAGGAMPASIIDPYLAVQTALADDSTDTVKANAGSIATSAAALGAPAMKIQTAALQLSAAASAATPDIEEVRAKFGTLSDALDTYMTGLKLAPGEGVRVAYCPMANKPWLQKGDSLANPYYGKEMLTCGNFR